jgi:release factor glutamine methyltransferase
MNIQELLEEARTSLKNNSPTASLDAEVLLCHCTGLKRSELISKSDIMVDDKTITKYRQIIKKRGRGVPVPYLTHYKNFYNKDFYVDERVLIPRPETEELVDYILQYLSNNPQVSKLIDVGTGSGAIAISIGTEAPTLSIFALDLSEEALAVTKKNIKKHHSSNVKCYKSDLLSEIKQEIDEQTLIVANLPYIGTETHDEVDMNTNKYEPHLALYSGKDGLDHYRRLFQQINASEKKCHALFLEIGSTQSEEIQKLIIKTLAAVTVKIIKDLNGLDRFVIIDIQSIP